MEKIIIDENQFLRTISRISHEIIEKHQTLDNLVIVGIKRRGAEIAELIKNKIKALTQTDIPAFDLDITFYRDDLQPAQAAQTPVYRGASDLLTFSIKTLFW